MDKKTHVGFMALLEQYRSVNVQNRSPIIKKIREHPKFSGKDTVDFILEKGWSSDSDEKRIELVLAVLCTERARGKFTITMDQHRKLATFLATHPKFSQEERTKSGWAIRTHSLRQSYREQVRIKAETARSPGMSIHAGRVQLPPPASAYKSLNLVHRVLGPAQAEDHHHD